MINIESGLVDGFYSACKSAKDGVWNSACWGGRQVKWLATSGYEGGKWLATKGYEGGAATVRFTQEQWVKAYSYLREAAIKTGVFFTTPAGLLAGVGVVVLALGTKAPADNTILQRLRDVGLVGMGALLVIGATQGWGTPLFTLAAAVA
ncbi:MAG: hypothetical protein WB791_01755 [Waddliaceae bacterium]